jgi:hypothetical protein
MFGGRVWGTSLSHVPQTRHKENTSPKRSIRHALGTGLEMFLGPIGHLTSGIWRGCGDRIDRRHPPGKNHAKGITILIPPTRPHPRSVYYRLDLTVNPPSPNFSPFTSAKVRIACSASIFLLSARPF